MYVMIPALPGSTTLELEQNVSGHFIMRRGKIKRGCQEFTVWTAAHQNCIRKDKGTKKSRKHLSTNPAKCICYLLLRSFLLEHWNT